MEKSAQKEQSLLTTKNELEKQLEAVISDKASLAETLDTIQTEIAQKNAEMAKIQSDSEQEIARVRNEHENALEKERQKME
mmetsp:Transcript_37911/g.49805  ORF Transcript_37911/g.49805 Transcript_37911/m.49805 type:complete len:81 (-) Transcript_37911:1206-1448(-)